MILLVRNNEPILTPLLPGRQVRPRNMALLGPTSLNAPPLLGRPDPPLVSPLTRFRSNQPVMENKPTHKNLYVLNLPLDASTDQLTALFSSYGTVVHCVILAMLDAQARRRGFIDMSNSNEAKEAIEGLNGFVWHGYPIEVSYAIVQRSGGPFDQVTGRNIIKRNVPRNRFNTGPRRVPSDSAIGANYFGDGANGGGYGISNLCNGLPTSGYSEAFGRAPGGIEEDASSATDPFTIFIAGLDPVAIIDDEDFRHALQPYGNITAATLCRDEHGTSRGFGIVTFGKQEEATNACENLNGKVINGRRLSAHKYVYQTHPSIVRASIPNSSGIGLSCNNTALPPRPASLQRRGFLGSNFIGNGTVGFPSLNGHNPLLNGKMMPRSPHSTPAWPPSPQNHTLLGNNPPQRLDQIPMGSIGSSLHDSWVSPSSNLRNGSNTASFFKASSTSKAIEIKPDLEQLDEKPIGTEMTSNVFDKQLGDAFMPIPKSATSSDRQSDATSKTDNKKLDLCDTEHNGTLVHSSYMSPSNPIALLRTPGSSASPWNSSNGNSTTSLGLDAMSPESTMSMTSSASSLSQLNTPEAIRGADSTRIWGHSAPHDRLKTSVRSAVSPGSWLSNSPPNGNDKQMGITGSAILSLQNNDIVEKSTNRGSNAMAPVGHEKKSSSPLRVLRPFQEGNDLHPTEC